jgi:hypothetical protein
LGKIGQIVKKQNQKMKNVLPTPYEIFLSILILLYIEKLDEYQIIKSQLLNLILNEILVKLFFLIKNH